MLGCIFQETYIGTSPYVKFITEIFITAIFQNFPDVLGLCGSRVISGITAIILAIFGPKITLGKSQ